MTHWQKISAALAATALAGWAGLTAPASNAATTVCGSNCAALYNLDYGTTDLLAVAGASGTSASPGQLIWMTQATNTNPGEDWVLNPEGTVADFYYAGILSSGLNTHYGSDEVYEYQYAPNGTATGYCLGVAVTNASGYSSVALEPCGVNNKTLWIFDVADQYHRDIPLITGTDTNFSYPYVLTGDTLGTFLHTKQITGGNGIINTGQYWATIYGPLP